MLCVDVRRTSAPKRLHARTRTHISENFSAPLRTEIAAPAHVRAHYQFGN